VVLGIDAAPGEATFINERGDVVGTIQVTGSSGETFTRAMLWERGDNAIELRPLPGSQNSSAVAINNRGDVVGYSANDGFGAVARATAWPWKGKPTND
jgi:uncharacterized membrane protein